MTTATLRISAPVTAPAAAKPAVPQKGFWARLLDALVEARQQEIKRKIARYTSKDGNSVYFPYI